MQGLLKITYEVVEDQQVGRKFYSQSMKPTGTLNCRTHRGDDGRSDSVGLSNNNPNISDYFRCRAYKGADKEANSLITQNIHRKFSDTFTEVSALQSHFNCRSERAVTNTRPHPGG